MNSNIMMNNKIAIVFPGQGSQSLGMLGEIAAQFSEVNAVFTEASAVLGYDLWQLTQTGPNEVLDKTVHTQPALLAAAYAIWQIIQARRPLTPTLLAGHSLGEYTALVCARSLSFADAIKLVAARGQYMQEAVAAGAGAMAAIIGLEDEAVAQICQTAMAQSTEIVSPANYNSIGQIVIAGHKAAVERAIVLAKEHGAKMAILVPISVPSHCQLMQPAAKQLANLLQTIPIKQPSLPVLNNADVSIYQTPEAIRAGLVKQLYSPVRWVETIQYFVTNGINHVIECGPGKILTGLNKRIDKNLQLLTTNDLSNLHTLLAETNTL